jgi:hydrogenase maturation factor HypF (carbamoyltransferase family)
MLDILPMDTKPFDNCLSCGTRFVGCSEKLPITLEADTHRRIAYLCPDCAQVKMAVIA